MPQRTDYFHRREAQVTYVIEFDNSAMEFTIAHNYPVSAFFADACALTVILGMSAWCLKTYHIFTRKDKMLFDRLDMQQKQQTDDEQDLTLQTLAAQIAQLQSDVKSRM